MGVRLRPPGSSCHYHKQVHNILNPRTTHITDAQYTNHAAAAAAAVSQRSIRSQKEETERSQSHITSNPVAVAELSYVHVRY
jgi:hypothetical protein